MRSVVTKLLTAWLGTLIGWVMQVPPLARVVDRAIKLFPGIHARLYDIAVLSGIDTESALRGTPLVDIPREQLTRQGLDIALRIQSTINNRTGR